MTGALARMCANHPIRTIIVWVILIVVALGVVGQYLPSATTTNLRLGSQYESEQGAAALESVLKDARTAVEALRAGGRTLRGEARRRALDRLAELDRRLPAAARAAAGDDVLRELRAEAQRSLEAFRSRMVAAAFAGALDAATDRLLAEHFKLPRLTFD